MSAEGWNLKAGTKLLFSVHGETRTAFVAEPWDDTPGSWYLGATSSHSGIRLEDGTPVDCGMGIKVYDREHTPVLDRWEDE